MNARRFSAGAIFIAIAINVAHAQQTQPAESEDATAAEWSFSLSAYTYIVPHDHDYVQPTFIADRDWLHLEARYNYEALETASAWIGYNFSFGDELTLDITPMLGGVFGDVEGIAPGYELTLGYGGFELYSESEYVFDLEESSESYFYTWSEVTYSFTDWFRAGLAIQRTKAYETDLDINRGLLLGFTYKQLDFSTCLFNLFEDDPVFVFAIEFSF